MDEQDGNKAQVSNTPSPFQRLGQQLDGADRAAIRLLKTGVPGLDSILGGGLPEYSFNIIAGPPGSGKTTFAQQMLFASASSECPAICFTILGEPSLKMMRYQQQFRFFDASRIGESLRFVNLASVVLDNGLSAVLDAIIKEVETSSPRMVVVDSFRTIRRRALEDGEMQMDEFVHRLALHLTGFQATTFLIGEYDDADHYVDPVFTVADGIIALAQSQDRTSVVRNLLIVKMRGAAHQPGLHPFRISAEGLQVFPRRLDTQVEMQKPVTSRRLSTGVPALDEMMGGGIPTADSMIVAGPSGSGKTAICTHFLSEGGRQGETGVVVIFEESPADYLARAEAIGCSLTELVEQKKLIVLSPRSLDLSVDETLQQVLDAVTAIDANRVVFDSLSGLELALASSFRDDFRKAFYRLMGSLSTRRVTVLSTVEVVESFSELRFSGHTVSAVTDNILLQRYVEIQGQLRTFMVVVKMRNSRHSKELRLYEVTDRGVQIGGRLKSFQGIAAGVEEPMDTDA